MIYLFNRQARFVPTSWRDVVRMHDSDGMLNTRWNKKNARNKGSSEKIPVTKKGKGSRGAV